MKKTVGMLLAGALLFALSGGGCDKQQGSCNPGEIRVGHGHTEHCGQDRKWHL